MKKKVKGTKESENVYEKPAMKEVKFETKKVPEVVAGSGCTSCGAVGCGGCTSCACGT